MNIKKVINFIFELGMLKRIKHEGWRVASVSNIESVADHSLRAAQIGYLLAEMEGYKNPDEICSILVFHDIGECRIGDIHKIANRYIEANEEGAVKDQSKELGETGKGILKKWKEFEYKNTEAGIIAKDADLLEQAVTAKEYIDLGYKTENWIKNVKTLLRTNSAKKLVDEVEKTDSSLWWQGLKKVN